MIFESYAKLLKELRAMCEIGLITDKELRERMNKAWKLLKEISKDRKEGFDEGFNKGYKEGFANKKEKNGH